MEHKALFEQHVRARLESSFGKAVAMLIVASASNSTSTNTMELDSADYDRLCCAIASDQRVKDMWGESGANEALDQWRSEAT